LRISRLRNNSNEQDAARNLPAFGFARRMTGEKDFAGDGTFPRPIPMAGGWKFSNFS
jgi:hypothetical protein